MGEPVVEVLIEARRLIGEVGWNQHANAKYRNEACEPLFSLAQSFCLVGAIERAAYNLRLDPDGEESGQARIKLQRAIGDDLRSIVTWNDRNGRTKDEVLELLQVAIDG